MRRRLCLIALESVTSFVCALCQYKKQFGSFSLIGKYSISGSISHNALYYYFGNLVVVLHAKLFFSLLLYIVTGIDYKYYTVFDEIKIIL